MLGDRGPTTSNPVEEGAEHPPGTAATDADPDDPKDPTDQVSGDAPPLADPVQDDLPPVAPPAPGDGDASSDSQ
jgi:proteasome alpha subunit